MDKAGPPHAICKVSLLYGEGRLGVKETDIRAGLRESLFKRKGRIRLIISEPVCLLTFFKSDIAKRIHY